MNIHAAILAEHSKAQAMKIVKWIGADKKRFAELVNVFLHGEYRITQRAGWPLSYCVEAHPELVSPHIGKLIGNLAKPGQHHAVTRNILRMLGDIDVPEKHLGKLTDDCFRLLQKSDEPIAIKAFAMTVLANIVKKEPELARELKLVIETMMPEASPAIRVRGKRALKMIEEMDRKKR